MSRYQSLISVFEQARELLALPENDFSWSSWTDSAAALAEIDRLLADLEYFQYCVDWIVWRRHSCLRLPQKDASHWQECLCHTFLVHTYSETASVCQIRGGHFS